MADVNLSVGSSNVLKQYSGYRPGQYINFYCSYSSAGVLSVRLNLSLTGSWNWNSDDSRAWINFNSSSVSGAAIYDGPDRQLSAGNHDVVTESETFTTAREVTVYAKVAVRAGTYGPTGDYGGTYHDTWWDPDNPPSDAKTNGGGRCFKFTISIPGIVSKCGAPNSIKINNTTSTVYASPSSSVTVSWSGASSGTGNSISSYLIEWGYSDGGWDYSTTYSTTSSSGSKSITLPSGEGKYIDFRVTTRGSAGSTYYSTPYAVYSRVKTFSTPAMPTVSASEQYGTFTITWSKASDETGNAIAGYDVYYQSSPNNSSWSSSVKIGSYTSSATGIEWENTTAGTYYRFGVVARRTNYGSSSLSNWTTGKQASAKPVDLTAPTNLTPSVTEIIGGNNITVTWGASTATAPNSIKNYALYYSLNNGSNTLISNSISASATFYTFKVPKSYGSMVFKIQALSSISSEYNSSIVSASQAVNVITGISDDLRMRFKKDGTIQCVKVVEKEATDKISDFDLTKTSTGTYTTKNGITLTFYINNALHDFIGTTGGPYYYSGSNYFYSNELMQSLKASKSTVSSAWDATGDVTISYIVVNYSLYYNSGNYRIDLTYNNTVHSYTGSFSGTGTITLTTTNPLVLTQEMRYTNTPVSISKDGTLTCGKLIQELGISKISDFDATLTSGTTITTKNGFSFIRQNADFPSSTKYIEFGSNGSPIVKIRLTRQGTSNNFTASVINTEDQWWYYNAISNIDYLKVEGNLGSGYITVSTPRGGSANYYGVSIIDGATYYSFSSSTVATYISASERFSPFNKIQLYKDGTVKCSNIQEATISAKPWTLSVATEGKMDFLFNSGYRVQLFSNGELFSIPSYYSLTFYGEKGSTYNLFYISSGQYFSVNSTMWTNMDNYTITNAYYSAPSSFPSTSDSYFNIIDPNGKSHRLSFTSYSGSMCFYGVNTSEDSSITVPASDRIMLSWD